MSRLLGRSDGRTDATTTFFADWTADAAADRAVAPDRQVDTSTSRVGDSCRASSALRRRALALSTLAVSAAAVAVFAPGPSASADPSAHTWYRLRMCESSDNYQINTGNGYYGAYQFDLSTWRSVGGSGYPNQASSAEQDARALMLYRMRGWQPWTCAGILGLREDSDARSGRTGDIHIGGSGGTSGASQSGIPAFPGSRWYHYGDWNNDIKRFQNQMHHRGFFPAGTGQYGPLTLAMVKRLQALNGLPVTGYIGPNTWRLAWTGKYSSASTATASKPVHSAPAVPRFPGTRWYRFGDWSSKIKLFQNAMHRRGFFPAGTGQYGPKTLRMVKQLQRQNGLIPNGLIGPKTWRLAWTGKYSRS